MTKKQAKKPIWEFISEEEIKEGKEAFQNRMQANDDVIAMLKERNEHFKSKTKPNMPPTLPTMQEFLLASQLHKLDHSDTILLIEWLWEQLIATNKQLATTLQYLDDNINNIAEKTDTKLSEMKTNVAEVQKNAIAILGFMKENKPTKTWQKTTEGTLSYVS